LLIYLIDNTIDGQGTSPRELRAVLGRLVEGLEILTEPFHAASPARVKALNPSHIILSGQSNPWEDYSSEALTGVFELIRNAERPVLGVCGGHQQIALAYGAQVDLMGRIEPGNGYNGAKRERGYFPIETNQTGLFEGLSSQVTVWHSHFDEVKQLPKGFKRTAWNDTCSIQAMQHETRPVFGVQFHPELFNDEHPDGRRIMEAFLRL
jgi:GMP synthase (glutamine-hydrolysing)